MDLAIRCSPASHPCTVCLDAQAPPIQLSYMYSPFSPLLISFRLFLFFCFNPFYILLLFLVGFQFSSDDCWLFCAALNETTPLQETKDDSAKQTGYCRDLAHHFIISPLLSATSSHSQVDSPPGKTNFDLPIRFTRDRDKSFHLPPKLASLLDPTNC